MVLAGGFDMSGLPETLKEDFEKLDRLEGRYRVTSFHIEVVNLDDLSPRKRAPCNFCINEEEFIPRTEEFMPIDNVAISLSKVIIKYCFLMRKHLQNPTRWVGWSVSEYFPCNPVFFLRAFKKGMFLEGPFTLKKLFLDAVASPTMVVPPTPVSQWVSEWVMKIHVAKRPAELTKSDT